LHVLCLGFSCKMQPHLLHFETLMVPYLIVHFESLVQYYPNPIMNSLSMA
jgi:hypothetical protein